MKTTGDGLLIEFASVVDAVRCAIAIQRDMARQNTEVSPEKRIEFRIGINLGDVVAEGERALPSRAASVCPARPMIRRAAKSISRCRISANGG